MASLRFRPCFATCAPAVSLGALHVLTRARARTRDGSAPMPNLHMRQQQKYRTLALRAAPPHTLVSEIFLVRLLDGIPVHVQWRQLQWIIVKKKIVW